MLLLKCSRIYPPRAVVRYNLHLSSRGPGAGMYGGNGDAHDIAVSRPAIPPNHGSRVGSSKAGVITNTQSNLSDSTSSNFYASNTN